jgi:hypothetical protein
MAEQGKEKSRRALMRSVGPQLFPAFGLPLSIPDGGTLHHA